MLMFPSIVAILFFLNCQKQDYIRYYCFAQYFFTFISIFVDFVYFFTLFYSLQC